MCARFPTVVDVGLFVVCCRPRPIECDSADKWARASLSTPRAAGTSRPPADVADDYDDADGGAASDVSNNDDTPWPAQSAPQPSRLTSSGTGRVDAATAPAVSTTRGGSSRHGEAAASGQHVDASQPPQQQQQEQQQTRRGIDARESMRRYVSAAVETSAALSDRDDLVLLQQREIEAMRHRIRRLEGLVQRLFAVVQPLPTAVSYDLASYELEAALTAAARPGTATAATTAALSTAVPGEVPRRAPGGLLHGTATGSTATASRTAAAAAAATSAPAVPSSQWIPPELQERWRQQRRGGDAADAVPSSTSQRQADPAQHGAVSGHEQQQQQQSSRASRRSRPAQRPRVQDSVASSQLSGGSGGDSDSDGSGSGSGSGSDSDSRRTGSRDDVVRDSLSRGREQGSVPLSATDTVGSGSGAATGGKASGGNVVPGGSGGASVVATLPLATSLQAVEQWRQRRLEDVSSGMSSDDDDDDGDDNDDYDDEWTGSGVAGRGHVDDDLSEDSSVSHWAVCEECPVGSFGISVTPTPQICVPIMRA